VSCYLENRVLRRIFWLKRNEVIGEWRNIHNKELNNLHSSSNIVRVIKWRKMRWPGMQHVRVEERCILGFGGETFWKEPLGRPRRRWEDNIKVGLQEVGCGSLDWIDLAYDRDRWRALANAAMNLRVP
jgi:hypothetical protein